MYSYTSPERGKVSAHERLIPLLSPHAQSCSLKLLFLSFWERGGGGGINLDAILYANNHVKIDKKKKR